MIQLLPFASPSISYHFPGISLHICEFLSLTCRSAIMCLFICLHSVQVPLRIHRPHQPFLHPRMNPAACRSSSIHQMTRNLPRHPALAHQLHKFLDLTLHTTQVISEQTYTQFMALITPQTLLHTRAWVEGRYFLPQIVFVPYMPRAQRQEEAGQIIILMCMEITMQIRALSTTPLLPCRPKTLKDT